MRNIIPMRTTEEVGAIAIIECDVESIIEKKLNSPKILKQLN